MPSGALAALRDDLRAECVLSRAVLTADAGDGGLGEGGVAALSLHTAVPFTALDASWP